MDDPGQQIQFPVTCEYRIVAIAAAENVLTDLTAVLDRFSLGARPEKGNLSRNGVYQTWCFSCTIQDLETLRALGVALSTIKNVKVVL